MPKNKNAYLRYRIIDQCLRNRFKYFNREALAERVSDRLGFNVSIYTIDKDLKALQDEFNAPIKYDNYYNRYYYSKPFTLEGFELNDEEKDALNVSIRMLDILKNTKYAELFMSTIHKLTAEAREFENDKIIDFEQSEIIPGVDLFDRLYEAIINKEALIITYCVYGKENKDHIISPYLIKEFRNRFYLVARKHDDSNNEELIYCFGMDRIKNILTSNEKYKYTNEFNSKDYFKHSIGITRKLFENPIEIIIKFSNFNAPYILSKPLHQSQKILKQTKDYLTISINVYDSFELDMIVLSYGAGLEIISPNSYREKIKNIVSKMGEIYKV